MLLEFQAQFPDEASRSALLFRCSIPMVLTHHDFDPLQPPGVSLVL